MISNWISVWHLLLPVALWVIIWQRAIRRSLFYGALCALPVLLLLPILSPTFFELFNPGQILGFLVSQAIIVFSLGILSSAVYEKVIRPKTVRTEKPGRGKFLVFGSGFLLALVLFDIFFQPLLPSLVIGLGLNLLLAIRYQRDRLYDIAFATILMGFFYVFIYAAVLFDLPGETGRFWFSSSLSGLTIFGLAVEKVVAIFVFGMFWGPLYVGLKDVFNKNN
jgi:hypothetical protein